MNQDHLMQDRPTEKPVVPVESHLSSGQDQVQHLAPTPTEQPIIPLNSETTVSSPPPAWGLF